MNIGGLFKSKLDVFWDDAQAGRLELKQRSEVISIISGMTNASADKNKNLHVFSIFCFLH